MEDVFNLGDEVEVKVDDVDPNGKVSLSLAGAVEIPDSAVSNGGGDRGRDRPERAPREARAPREDSAPAAAGADTVSFEDAFESEAREQFGDLGPTAAPEGGGRGGERRGGGGGGRRGGGGGRR